MRYTITGSYDDVQRRMQEAEGRGHAVCSRIGSLEDHGQHTRWKHGKRHTQIMTQTKWMVRMDTGGVKK